MGPQGKSADLLSFRRWCTVEGRRHDSTLLRQSGLLPRMKNDNMFQGYCIFGDQAYGLHPCLMAPYRGVNLGAQQLEWNRKMQLPRVSVEWFFGIITKLWQHLAFVPLQKVFLTPSVKHYIVATFLTNCHNCFNPNQISKFFAMEPCDIHQYCSDLAEYI
mmetsp:Transcript_21140/g.27739  ORF Transcript_21140/g.27739 Transcript_21140/m.27739 type:complete len:160 (-) Transcript_21140:36-515(-)